VSIACRHFFPDFNLRVDRLRDPRRPDMSTYTGRHLIWSGLMMMMAGIGSRLQHTAETAQTRFLSALLHLSGSSECTAAHPGTINYLMMHLRPSQLLDLNAGLVHRLLRMRCFERFRFGVEWLVAVDASEIRTYSREHCPNCLHRKLANGTVQYFHAILEAKLILANGMVLSLCSVPILNLKGRYDKQDCELKAFPRLAADLKRRFPKLPICLLLDSLYGCLPVFRLCRQMHWSHITVLKKGRTPGLWKRAVLARDHAPQNRRTVRLKSGTTQELCWATNLKHGGETVHAVFCVERRRNGSTTQWAWTTDHRPDKDNVHILANKGGRLRWKIENEGFNVQKNGEIGLEHDYGSQGHAWYNYYLLAQTAHLLQQLCWYGDLVRRLSQGAYQTMSKAFRTVRNFAARLRQALHTGDAGPPGDSLDPAAIQIRFCSS
jgi:hypothetical protein